MPTFSFPWPPAAGILSALTAGLAGWGGAAALRIPCESHRMTGARAPVWYLHSKKSNRIQKLGRCNLASKYVTEANMTI